MQQYFVENKLSINDLIAFDEKQSHHIQHVMRFNAYEKVRVVDSNNDVYLAHIEYQQGKVYAYIEEKIEENRMNKVKIILACALIKKDKWDLSLQKCSELGVDEIIPLQIQRCVVNVKGKEDKKHERWVSILKESAKQCNRNQIVKLHDVATIDDLKRIEADLKLVAYEDADYQSEHLKDVLKANPHVKSLLLVVGCEGGFAKEEISKLISQGFVSVSLGPRILRAETASMAFVSMVSFFYELVGDNYE